MANTQVTSGGTLSVVQYQSQKIAEEAAKVYNLKETGVVGPGSNFAIQEVDDLKDSGDSVVVYLRMALATGGVGGDGTLEGNEESLAFYQDQVYIFQQRQGVRLDGRLSEQRTKIQLRKEARSALSTWAGEFLNELTFTMLSGARGINANGVAGSVRALLPLSFTGFGSNTLVAPDTDHLIYFNSTGTKAAMASTDKFSLAAIDAAVTKARTISPMVRPLKVNGEDKYVMFIHPWQERDLRVSTSTGQWLDIQKAAMQGGKISDNPILVGSLGEYNGVILRRSHDIRLFNDYGSGSNVGAARAILMGAQAGALAWGKGYDMGKFDYQEITKDYNNQTGFSVGMMLGIKPLVFNSKRLGMIAVDTAAAA